MPPSIVIVGHAPSMKGSGLGEKIDAHDIVIRLKLGLTNEDFGFKTNVVCCSTEVIRIFKHMEADEYWAYPKNGYFDGRTVIDIIAKVQKPVLVPLAYCKEFNTVFAKTASHPNVSTGMAAILIALYRYQTKELSLAGFDTLLDPTIDFQRHPEVPSTGLGVRAGHDWEAENDLLKSLNVRIKCLQ